MIEVSAFRRRKSFVNIIGSVALVTGANRGLGARLVAELLRRDVGKVYATARTPGTLPSAAGNDPRVHPLTLDVTDQASLDTAAKAAPDVTLLINNAGVLGFGGVLDGDLELFDRDLRTNYFGTLRAIRTFVPVLKANGGGAITNVLTLIALAPVGPMAGYSASKAATR